MQQHTFYNKNGYCNKVGPSWMQQIIGAGESSSQHAFLYVSGIGVPGKMKNNAVPLLLVIYLYYLVFGF